LCHLQHKLIGLYLSITLPNEQLDAQIFNTFITILYMYMFRAIPCSSSGGQIVLVLNFLSKQFFLNLCTGLSLTLSDDTTCCINLLKPTGYVMNHQFNILQLYALPTPYLCVLYLSENNQQLVPLTA